MPLASLVMPLLLSAPSNVVHLEVGGPSLLYALSYERFFAEQLSVRVGLSVYGLLEEGSKDTLGVFAVPITAQYFLGSSPHYLELGLGLNSGVLWSDLNAQGGVQTYGLLLGTATVGYRYQPDSGFMARIAITPVFGGDRFAPLGLPFQPWAALGVGYTF